MLSVTKLTKKFDNKIALSGVSFNANVGEVIGLLGKNGAGKSTILRILSGYLLPDHGKLELQGYSYHSKKIEVSNLLGYVADNPTLYPELTVYEFLSFVAQLRKLHGRQLKLALDEVIQDCQLTRVINVLCGQLSRGYQQRTSIAQALIHKPKLLLLDEPTIGLDPEQLQILKRILVKSAKDSIVLFSSHMLSEVSETCSRVLVFDKGQLLTDVMLDKNQGSHNLQVLLQAA